MEIRLIAPGEEELCNQFQNRIYGKERSLEQWHWDFVANNYDRTPIPYAVVSDGGRIAGTQAFIPIRMIDSDGVYWTAKSEETLVDPDYRGQKLFEKMYAVLFDYAREHEFAWIWGFTPATKAFVRLDFTVPDRTEQLFMPFSSRSIPVMMAKSLGGKKPRPVHRLKIAAARTGCLAAQALSSIKASSGRKRAIADIDIRTMEKADEQTGDLCRRFIANFGGTTIYRDAKYLEWRLYNNPYCGSVVRALYKDDKLLGYVAFALGDDGMGYLVDLLVPGDDTRYATEDLVRMLLLEAVYGTRNMGATGIRGWRVNNHPFDKLIGRIAGQIGFYHIRRGYDVVLYNCEAGQKRAVHGEFDQWYVSRIFTEGVLG